MKLFIFFLVYSVLLKSLDSSYDYNSCLQVSCRDYQLIINTNFHQKMNQDLYIISGHRGEDYRCWSPMMWVQYSLLPKSLNKSLIPHPIPNTAFFTQSSRLLIALWFVMKIRCKTLRTILSNAHCILSIHFNYILYSGLVNS